MSSASTINLAPLLKIIYPNGIAFAAYKRSRFLAMVQKDTKFGGDSRYVVLDEAGVNGGSSDFATALANVGNATPVRFQVHHKKEYQIVQLQGDLIARSMGNTNAIMSALKHQFDKADYNFGRALGARVWGGAGGRLGVISGATTSATITLATAADASRFEVGMWCQFSVDDGTPASPAGLRGSGAQLQITAITRTTSTGTATLTFSAAVNTVTGTVSGDSIFRSGDYANTMTGVAGWVPVSNPTGGESFHGVDRSLGDMQRRSGIRVSGGGASKEETLITASARAFDQASECDTVFLNPLDQGELIKEVGSKRVIDVNTDTPGIGFRALEVDGAGGVLKCVAEVDVPRGYAWMVKMDDWALRTAGECPRFLDEDGVGKLLRVANDDAYQARMGAYGNLFCENPGGQVAITW